MSKDDFASLMEASVKSGSSRATRRLHNGDVVEGTIIQIAADAIFVDIGTPGDARIDRSELEDRSGNVTVKVGDPLRATVVSANSEGPVLTLAMGRGTSLDLTQLQAAREGGVPVSGKVTKAVKGGLELEIGGVRAFCPASQVEIGYAADLGVWEGQEIEVKVIEIKDGGRSVVVSRRALLEDERQRLAEAMSGQLVPGADLTGTVRATQKHGVIVDVGGVDGFVHVSELAHRRVESPEDVVSVGDTVEVRVVSLEKTDKGLRLRLSMKARIAAEERARAAKDEVLAGRVSGHVNGGVLVTTSKGDGLVPLRELGLPPGADHRRAFPVGKEADVVLLERDPNGRQRFSMTGVSRVQERQNYRDFAQSPAGGGSMGSLGDLLREKLNLPAERSAESEPQEKTEEPTAVSGEPRPGIVRRKR
ncbi:MAG: S1 RNA-binding domain-containing protein [Myxococcales bacterium]|nr:S1 RNA-binding domain-containing protein [Myxococcales bacterium]MCB9578618.1 S1 RNA-binding domain-containing protein [Polyangiaceae bacterium]